MAEEIFRQLATNAGLADKIQCDSAGTGGWQVGELPDHRMRKVAEARGLQLTHLARKLSLADFDRFDYIVCMDWQNLRDAKALLSKRNTSCQLMLLRDFDPSAPGGNVPDPYHEPDEVFTVVADMLALNCSNLLAHLLAQHSLSPT